jgi:hypothetical protein
MQHNITMVRRDSLVLSPNKKTKTSQSEPEIRGKSPEHSLK